MEDTLHIYCRVSTQIQSEKGTSLTTQKESGINLSKKLKLKYKVWNEGGKSSHSEKIEDRPILSELFNEIRKGNVKHLFVLDLDRLSRNKGVFNMVSVELLRHNVQLYLKDTVYDLKDGLNVVMVEMLSTFSQYENWLRVQRSKRGKLQKLKDGKWMGGDVVYGYKLVDGYLKENKEESKWVKRIFKEYINHTKYEDISNLLFQNGVKSRRGKLRWSNGSIQTLLTNTHYRGFYYTHNHQSDCEIKLDKLKSIEDRENIRKCSCEKIKSECPSIITEKTYQQYKELRDERKRIKTNRVHHKRLKYHSLLSDVIVCGECNTKMYHQSSYSQSPFYFCKNKSDRRISEKKCKKTNVNSNQIDELVYESILNVLEKSHLYRQKIKTQILTQSEKSKKKSEIIRINNKVDKINSDIIRIDNFITQHQTNSILERVSQSETKKIIENLREEKVKIEKERIDLLNELQKFDEEEKWLDWYKEFGKNFDDLRKDNIDTQTKRKLINEVVNEIIVTDQKSQIEKEYSYNNKRTKTDTKQIVKKSINVLSHRINISFKLPFVGDELNWKNKKDKKKGYTLKEGTTKLEIEYFQKFNRLKKKN